jgi:choline dehydrogenase-like flavoprotein
MSDFDAIVIGTGFGGAVAACRLVGANKRICVLERGRRYESQPPAELKDDERPWSDFPDLPRDNDPIPDPKRWAWGDEQGLWDLRNLVGRDGKGGMMVGQAAGYGGGSLIYANVHLRAPAEVFEGWPFKRHELDPYYDLAAYMLNAKPITEAGSELPEKTEQFRKAVDALGRNEGFFYPPLAVNFDGSNEFGRHQVKCNNCGECITGCRFRAKNTLDFNYLAIVDDSPLAEVRTQAEAVSISEREEGGYDVKYRDHLRGGSEEVVSAAWVFVCAGTINSTELLLKSHEQRGLPNLSKEHLGSRYYPNADFPAIVYDAQTRNKEARLLAQTKGPTITASLYHQAPSKPWCLVEEGGFPVQMARHFGVFRAPALLRRNRHDDRKLRANEIVPVDGNVSPEKPSPLPDCDQPLLRSLIDGLYALLANESKILKKIAHPQLLDAVDKLEKEFQDFQDKHLLAVHEAVIERAKKKLLGNWYLRPFPDFIKRPLMELFVSIAQLMVGDTLAPWIMEETKQVLRERYSLGETGSERVELAKQFGSWLLKFDDARGAHSQNSLILLGMGPDSLGGRIEFDNGDLRVTMEDGWDADLSETESLMRDVACALGGKLRVNPLWSFARTPVTVHSQGGCPMSADPDEGVTNPVGEVHGHPGLFVMDAAAFPTSIGVNPAATITAVAERNMAQLLGDPREHKQAAAEWWAKQAWTGREDVAIEPRRNGGGVQTVNRPIGIAFDETMSGFHWASPVPAPDSDSAYRAAEVEGRRYGSKLRIKLAATIDDVAGFIHSKQQSLDIAGTAGLVWAAAGIKNETTYDVSGTLTLPGLGPAKEKKMSYELRFHGVDIVLDGFKRIRNDPGTDSWRDTSRLLTTLSGPGGEQSYGIIHVALDEFLFDQLKSFRVLHTDDPARIAWGLSSFGAYFFGSLQRIYLPQLEKAVEGFLNLDLR